MGDSSRRPVHWARLVTTLFVVVAVVGLASPTRAQGPSISWARLRNPILRYPDRAAKDPALVWSGGQWVVLFSSIASDGHWSINVSTSPDLRTWSVAAAMPHDPTVEGEASPDVVRTPSGPFVVTYQSFVHDTLGSQAKLYYRTTVDFRSFSPPYPLALGVHPGSADRLIDAAVVWSPAGLLLGYKYGGVNGGQEFELARSTTGSLDGPWVSVGTPRISVYGDTIENYQFLHLNGGWQLLATSNMLDQPTLFTLTGDPHAPTGWLQWSAGRHLQVPQEHWNIGRGTTGSTYEHANCAFLVDRRAIGGRFYLVYADSSELTAFLGVGHAQLAIARSTDLVHWSVPPH